MQELFKQIAESIAIGVEGAAALIIGYGACEALWGATLAIAKRGSKAGQRKDTGCASGFGYF